jgi:hypothetical protein
MKYKVINIEGCLVKQYNDNQYGMLTYDGIELIEVKHNKTLEEMKNYLKQQSLNNRLF